MKNRERIEELFKNAPWFAYKEGYNDGWAETENRIWNNLRNHAAVAAMQGLLIHDANGNSPDTIASMALSFANALIKEIREEKSV